MHRFLHRDVVVLTGLLLLVVVIKYAVKDNPFFWDTVQLASKHAHWYYQHNFSFFHLPDEIDSGHPPFFGIYHAFMWTVFGKSMAVSHFSMLPFLLGIVIVLYLIGRYYFQEYAYLLPVFLLANPVLLTQMLLISPDVVLVFGFLLALYGVLINKNWMRIVGSLLLVSISTRGMMCVCVLFVFDLIIAGRRDIIFFAKATIPYSFSGLLAFGFLLSHYLEKGWIGYHEDSPWASLFAKAEGFDYLKNLMVLVWRFVDHGLLFVWLGMLGMLKLTYSQWEQTDKKKLLHLIVLFLLISLLLSYPIVAYKGLHGHRYLLPAMICLQLLAFVWVFTFSVSTKMRIGIFAFMFLGLLSGNFWVYPERISQGWDSTLAHLPYYKAKKQMITYLDLKAIPLDSIGTVFPEIGPQKYLDLSERESGFSRKDIANQQYILYSNIMNDFTNEEIEMLHGYWQIKKEIRLGAVRLVLFENEEQAP